MELTPEQQKNIDDLAKVGKVAKLLAEISEDTGMSIEELVSPNSMIVALAKKELENG